MPSGVHRISISLPEEVYRELDNLVRARGFTNRSQAIAEMINNSLLEHYKERGAELMAGTITLFYDESKPGLLAELASIQRSYIDEVISSQHVLLEKNQTMEILIVQGPARRLKRIADRLITCKGIKSGRLTMSPSILPPIHPLPNSPH